MDERGFRMQSRSCALIAIETTGRSRGEGSFVASFESLMAKVEARQVELKLCALFVNGSVDKQLCSTVEGHEGLYEHAKRMFNETPYRPGEDITVPQR